MSDRCKEVLRRHVVPLGCNEVCCNEVLRRHAVPLGCALAVVPPVLTRADGTVAGLSEYVDGDEELILSF